MNTKTTLIVYLKCQIETGVDPQFLFLELIELPDQKSRTLYEHLLECLSSYGFTEEYLNDHLVCFTSDGASVMTDKKSGVVALLKTLVPTLITWHCLNHRLELSIAV